MNTSQLTFTRFIVAILIVFLHYGEEIFSTNSDFFNALRSHLNLGVSYFYVLSGFVMMLAYGQKNMIEPKQYYINRFARIYPLHIFASILVLIIGILISLNYLEFYHFPDFSLLIKHIFLVQAWFPESALSLNTPSWSISVEMFFYFCFPFIFNYFIKKYSLKAIAIVIFSFWIINQFAMNWLFLSPYCEKDAVGGGYSLIHTFLFFNPLLHLNQFCIGLLFGAYFIKQQTKAVKNYDFLILIIFIATCFMIYFFRDILLHNGLMAINFAFLMYFISKNGGKITKLFQKRFLVHLGEISFAVYLLQTPIFTFSTKIFKALNINNPYLIFFVTLIFLIIISHFIYKWIEIPCKDKIKKLLIK